MFRRFVLPYFQAPSDSKIAVKDGLFLEEEGATNVLLMSGTSQPNTQHCFAEDFNLLYIQGVPGGMFLTLKYTDIIQNIYIRS